MTEEEPTMPPGMRTPTYKELVAKVRTVAREREEWAGIPTPMGDLFPMTIEPRHPYRIDEINKPQDREDGWRTVNYWVDKRLGLEILIQKNREGRARVAYIPGGSKVDMLLGSLGIMDAWLEAAENRAQTKLWNMIGHHRFTQYRMIGLFPETSKRSGVIYIFRRLRPTIALKGQEGGFLKILCTLCLHPIGYYHGAWGGVMVPTDEVIAHLTMMRGDEHKFWANANQHSANAVQSGI
jgi:hypothetical protein